MRTPVLALLGTLLIFGSLSPPLQAMVIVENFQNVGVFGGDGMTSTQSFFFDTNAASNSVVFVGIGSENVGTVNSVSFDGDVVTTPVPGTFGDTIRETRIYAFNLGTAVSAVGLEIQVNASTPSTQGYALSVLQVSNADFSTIAGSSFTTDGSSFAAGADTSLTVPTLPAGSLVFDINAENGFGGDQVPNGLTRSSVAGVQGGFNAASRSSYIENTTGGSTIGYTNLSGSASLSAVWIAPIPEPASAFLVTGLGLAIIGLRRRRRA